jgi:UDP-N-acetyl-2-amino-2-deoxyglucuronate dehydrogenase
VHQREVDKAGGFLQLKNARVRWFLSINSQHLPLEAIEKKKSTFRSITVDGEEVEFSEGFTDLHTMSYRNIIGGEGFGLADARQSILIVEGIRNRKPDGIMGEVHPLVK